MTSLVRMACKAWKRCSVVLANFGCVAILFSQQERLHARDDILLHSSFWEKPSRSLATYLNK
jgi:hypothetical protein